MEHPKDIDAWADALLDQHRTAPAGESKRLNEPAPLEDLPPMVRLSMKFGGDHPTREQAERMRRAAERHQRIAKYSDAAMLAGGTLLAVIVYVVYSGF